MIREYKTRDAVLQAFREFFEWTYEVKFTPGDVSAVEQQILVGWSNTDESDLRLVKYIIHLQSLVADAAPSDAAALRSQARANLKVEFSRPAANDAARILSVVHGVIETLRPASTGVPRINRATPHPSAPQQPERHPAQGPSAVALQPPIDLATIKNLIQAAAQSMSAATNQTNVPGQHAMMPAQRYVAPAVLASAVPAVTHALAQAAAPAPPPDPYDPRALLAQQEEENRENAALQLASNISKGRQDTRMKIIGNIG